MDLLIELLYTEYSGDIIACCHLQCTVQIKEIHFSLGTAVAQWSRCCATNRKVVGLIPDGVSGLFIDINTSDRTMALGSTQPLTEMSTRSIF